MVEHAEIFNDMSSSSMFTNSNLLQKSYLTNNTGKNDSLGLEQFELEIEEKKGKKPKVKKEEKKGAKVKKGDNSKLLSDNS